MLSLSNGKLIARIDYKSDKPSETRSKATNIYITTDESEKPLIDSKVKDTLLPRSFFNDTKLSPHKVVLLKKHIRAQTEPEDTELKTFYNQGNELLDEMLRKVIEFDKSEASIFPVPDKEQRWLGNYYIAGASGSGKSFWIGKYLAECRKIWKSAPIYVFSMVQEDMAYKALKPIYIKIDETILQDPLDPKEFRADKGPSFLIFDDIEVVSNKRLAEAVETFQNLCLETGRHDNLVCFNVSHCMLNGNRTKKIINESDHVIFYPNSNFAAISTFLRRYNGFMKNDLNTVKDIGKKSRWIMLSRPYPTHLVFEYGVRIV